MSKKKSRRKLAPSARRNRYSRRRIALAIVVFAVFMATGVILAKQVRNSRRRSTVSPASTAAGSPLKEYVFIGARMVATEEPGSGSGSLSAPTGVVASATTSTSISLVWTAPSGTIDHYTILRTKSLSDPFPQTINTPNNTTSFTDTVAANFTYLYQVAAVPPGGGTASSYSTLTSQSFATAYSLGFSPPVQSGSTITQSQINSIRTAIGFVRTAAGRGAFPYQNAISSGSAIHATDVTDMQSALATAYSALGFSAPGFNRAPSVGQAVLAADYNSVANATRAAP